MKYKVILLLLAFLLTQSVYIDTTLARWYGNSDGVFPIIISNSSVLLEQQVNIFINSSDFQNITWSNNGSDLHFTYDDNATLIPFWIKNWTNISTSNASIVFKTNQSLVNMWVGDLSASSLSNATTTFLFGDDQTTNKNASYFKDGSTWRYVANGFLNITETNSCPTGECRMHIYDLGNMTQNYTLYAEMRIPTSNANSQIGFIHNKRSNSSSIYNYIDRCVDVVSSCNILIGGTADQVGGSSATWNNAWNTWYSLNVTVKTDGSMDFYIYNSTGIWNITTRDTFWTTGFAGFYSYQNVLVAAEHHIRNIQVSKFMNSINVSYGMRHSASDTVAPIFNSITFSATSGTVNTAFTVIANLTEVNNMAFSKMEVQDPNQQLSNLSMAEDSINGSIHIHSTSYTPTIVGNYSFKFYARDGAGYQANYTSNVTYIASIAPTPSPAGGGGGNIVITQCGNKVCEINENKDTCAVDCAAKFQLLEPQFERELKQIVMKSGFFSSNTYEFRIKNLVDEDLNMIFSTNTSWLKFDMGGSERSAFNSKLNRKGATDSGIGYIRLVMHPNATFANTTLGEFQATDGRTIMAIPVVYVKSDTPDYSKYMTLTNIGFGVLLIVGLVFFIKGA